MSFTWTEIHTGNLDVPQMSLAGRTDDVVTTRAEGLAAVVAAGSQALMSMSVRHAIEQERRRQEQFVANYFDGHERGGIIAVACIDNTRVGELQGQRFMWLSLQPNVFGTPRDAIGHWRRQPQLGGWLGTPSFKFWWITRARA